MATNPLVNSLTDQMTQLAMSGAPDLQMSIGEHQNLMTVIEDQQARITAIYNQVSTLVNYGNVGNWVSANDTKRNLINDVIGFPGSDGFLKKLQDYLDYLEKYAMTVNAAFNRISSEDHVRAI